MLWLAIKCHMHLLGDACAAVPGFIILIAGVILPESPSSLAEHGQIDKARKVPGVCHPILYSNVSAWEIRHVARWHGPHHNGVHANDGHGPNCLAPIWLRYVLHSRFCMTTARLGNAVKMRTAFLCQPSDLQPFVNCRCFSALMAWANLN